MLTGIQQHHSYKYTLWALVQRLLQQGCEDVDHTCNHLPPLTCLHTVCMYNRLDHKSQSTCLPCSAMAIYLNEQLHGDTVTLHLHNAASVATCFSTIGIAGSVRVNYKRMLKFQIRIPRP